MQYSETLVAMAGPTRKQDDTLEEKQRRTCRLLIFERDALVRDTCARLADSLDCDLYSSAYIDNFESIVRRFEPSGIIMDIGLFDSDGIELLLLVAKHAPHVKVLFLAGDDIQLAESAEKLAWSIGLHVEANLQRPVSKTLLEQSLRRMT